MPNTDIRKEREITPKNMAQELEKIQNSNNTEELPELDIMVKRAIELCNAEYLEEEERKKKELERRRRAWAFEYIIIRMLIEMKQYAAAYAGIAYANSIRAFSEKYLPELLLRKASAVENIRSEQKINSIRLTAEKKMIRDYQNELVKKADALAEVKSLTREKDFELKKTILSNTIAKILAVHIIADNIKGIKIGMDDMAVEGAGEALSQAELAEMTGEMLTEQNVNTYAATIRGRDDFKKMIADIKTEEQLKAFKNKALDGSGRQIKKELFKAGQRLIEADKQKAMAAKILEADPNADRKKIPDGPLVNGDID